MAVGPESLLLLKPRDKPPSCLVDAALGQHKYVKLKGVKFHYVESGRKSAPLILLLHGFPDCWLSWRHQIPILSEHFRVVALDLKGFGDSDKPSSRKTYRFDLILEELNQLIISLGVGACVIIGHDIGAFIGWCFAQDYPQVVQKLIVVSCPHPNVYRSTLHTTSSYQWINFVQLPFFPELDALKEDVKLLQKCHKHLSSDNIYLEAYKYTFSRKEDWTGPLNYFRNLLHIQLSKKTIQVPTVLITGNKDSLSPLENAVNSTDFCDKYNVKIINGASHFPHQEKPSQFNEILLKILGKESLVKPSLGSSPSKRLMTRMMRYGNTVLDTVQKKTGTIPRISLLHSSLYENKTGNSI